MASSSLILARCRGLLSRGRVTSLRGFSTGVRISDDNDDFAEDRVPSQPFVRTHIEPGEWDPAHTNPLYRPKFKSSARIISADDFAARPTVGFTGEFETLQDAMVTLSWLDQSEQNQIYRLYVSMMVGAETQHGKTSHEYVMRVIAQKYNITAERVAGVVQLQHNEEQILLNEPDRKLLTETANRMDAAIKQEINDAYQTFNLRKPDSFTEDPVGVNELQDRKKWMVAADLFDVDQMTMNATVRDERKARLLIDGHVYVEDVDDESIPVPMDKDCRYLLKQKETIATGMAHQEQTVLEQRAKKAAVEPVWRTTNGEGETRDRWKYIAQTVNTRQLKKARAKHRSYINNSAENTLVEYKGELRPGNMADLKSVAWKLTRHPQEHIYAGAKKGWLDRVNRNAVKTWGKAPARVDLPVEAVAAAEATTVTESLDVAAVDEGSPVAVAGDESSLASAVVDESTPVAATVGGSSSPTATSADEIVSEDVNAVDDTESESSNDVESDSSSSNSDEESSASSSSDDDSDGPDKPTDKA